MPVEAPQISIDPYKSQVPLVQIPQEDLQRAQPMPEQAGYMGKAGSVMAISDSLMKGALKGLQMKEEKKYKTAQAVMGAQDAAISDTKKRYEDSLVTKGPEDAGTKAAWEAYTKTVNEAAEARQAFAVPEKTAKPAKGQKKDKKAPDGAPAAGGFGAGLKQFFERNPHIIPELSIIGMKSQVDPKLYGQMTPELMARKADTDSTQRQEKIADIALGEAQRKQAAQKTYDLYSGLSSDELTALPREVQQQFQSAKDVLFPPYQTRTTRQYISPDGKNREWYIPGMEPEGWNAVASGAQTKPGTESEYTGQALKGYGYTAENAPAPLLKYLHDNWQYKQAQTTSGSHEQLAPDPVTGKMVAVKLGSSTTKSGQAPKPPQGFAPLGEDGMPQQGGMTAPPQQAAPKQGAPKAAGKMTAPPSATQKTAAPKVAGQGAMTPPPTGVKGLRNTGLSSMHVAENTQKIETEKTTRYGKAEDAYKKALAANQKEYEKIAASLLKAGQWNTDAQKQQKTALENANKKSAAELEAAKGEIGKWYEQQVHAVGGSMPGENVVNLTDGRVLTFKNKADADAAKRDLGNLVRE